MSEWRKAADRYLGAPYGDGDGEFRCWELLRAVYSDVLGVDLPSYSYDPYDRESLARLIRSKLVSWREVSPGDARAGDAVLLWVAKPSIPSHVGLYLGSGEMLHTMEGFARDGQAPSPIGAVIERVDAGRWAKRVSGYYRHESQFPGWTLRVRPHPFRSDALEIPCPAGESIYHAMLRAGVVQDKKGGKVVVAIGDEVIDPKWFARVKPRAGIVVDAASIPGDPISLFFLIGGITGSALIGTSAAIAAPLAIAAGVIGSAAITVGIGFAAQALMSSLAGQPESGNGKGAVGPAASPAANGVSNQLDPFGPVPVHYGTVKIFPPLAAPAYTSVAGADKYWNLILCVGRGRYQISDIEVAGVPIDQIPGALYEVVQGGEPEAYAVEIAAESPIDYWRMASGANSVGARPSLTASGALFNQPSITNDYTAESAYFDGVNDYLTGTAPFTDLSGAWTVALWVRPSSAQDATIIHLGDAAGSGNGFSIRLDRQLQGGTGAVVAEGVGFTLYGAGRSYPAYAVLPANSTSRAFFVALRRAQGTDGLYRLSMCVDGVMLGSVPDEPINAPSNSLTIGARKNGATYDQFFAGHISEVAFFDTGLSDDTLRALAHLADPSVDVDSINRRGPPISLYNDTVLEVPINEVFEPRGAAEGDGPIFELFTTRSIPGEVSELQFEAFWPSGIWRSRVSGNGDVKPETFYAGVDVEYRLEGSGDGGWKKAGRAGLRELQGQGSWRIEPGGEIHVEGYIQREFLLSWSFPVARGRYEMRWRGFTIGGAGQRNGGGETAQAVGGYQFLAFRGLARNQEPVRAGNVALIGLRLPVKETGSTVGQISCIATRMLKTVSGGVLSTTETATTNGAWAVLDALRGPEVNARPIDDADIDLAAFESFSARAKPCNLTVDFRTNVQDLANMLAAPSFASVGYNGQWTVVEDRAGLSAVQVITPRNSKFLGGAIRRPDLPHALRVKYVDAAKGYQERETLVYDDGYNEDGSGGLTAATKFEAVEIRGLTDKELVRQHFRIRLAMARLRIEEWRVEMFLDHLRARRGSVVKFTHWAALVGQTSARVTSITTGSGGTTVVNFTVDEVLTYVGATNYGVVWRTANGTVARADATNLGAGESQVISFVTPQAIASAPAVGDVIAFGIRNEETTDALVREVMRQPGFKAELSLIPYAPTVFDAPDGPVPYDPIVNLPIPYAESLAPLPPAIVNIGSDERFIIASASGFTPRMRVLMQARNTSRAETDAVQIRSRLRTDIANDGAPVGIWEYSAWDSTFPYEAYVTDVVVGFTYEVQARSQTRAGVTSAWGPPVQHVVVGTSTPPPDVTDVRVNGTFIWWKYENPPADFDGFKVRFVYGIPRDPAAVWDGAHQPHQGVIRGTTFPVEHIPRTNDQEVTVLVRAVDVAGNLSVNPASVLFVGTVEGENIVTVLHDGASDGWPGLIVNGTVSGDALEADGYAEVPMFPEDAAPMFPVEAAADMFGVLSMPMQYVATINVPKVSEGRRLFTAIGFTPSAAHPKVEWRTYGPSAMFSGDPESPMFVEDDGPMFPAAGPIWASDSDAPMFPADSLWPGPEWSAWQPWPGQLQSPQLRSYQLRVSVPSMQGGAELTRFRVYSDVPDLVESLQDVPISAEGSRLPITKSFESIKIVAPILQSVTGQAGKSVRVVDREAWGPLIEVIDETGARVEGLIDADVRGVPLLV